MNQKNYIQILVNLPQQIKSIRFDKYLRTYFQEKNNLQIKQSEIQKAIRKKFFIVNNVVLDSASFHVENKFNLSIDKFFYEKFLQKQFIEHNNFEQKTYNPPKNLLCLIKKSIIFENENIIILNKPSGICVQAGTKISHSLDRILNYIYNDVKIVHRLDKKTTGVLIFAKNLEYAQKISKELSESSQENLLVQKKYILIARLIENNNKKAQFFLKNSEIIINEKLHSIEIGSEEIIVCDNKNGKESKTKFLLLKKFVHEKEIFYKIEADLFTGRKHQIRAHLSSVGFVILGDEKYEKFLLKNQSNISRNSNNASLGSRKWFVNQVFLHAKSINIPSVNISIEAEEPDYFMELLKNSIKH